MEPPSIPVQETQPELTSPHRKTRGALALIFFTMTLDVMGLSLLTPVAPQLVLRFSHDAIMVTMVTIMYAAGQFVASPLLGKLGDRYGRRPVLLLSIFGQSIGYFIFALGGSLWVLFLGRLIGGLTAGNLSTANAYIADVSAPQDRSKNFALGGIAWSLGLIFGPALGGLFGQISLEAPAYAAAVLSLLNVILGIFLLPESHPEERRTKARFTVRDYNPILAIFDISGKPGLGLLLLVYALFSIAFNGVNSTSSLFVIDKFSAQTWQISLMLILGGLSMIFNNTILLPRLVRRFGVKLTCFSALIGLVFFYNTIFFAPTMELVYPLYMIASCMNGFIFPALTTMSAERVEVHEIGILMGVSSSIGSLMNVIGPLYAGVVYDHVMVGAPYWMGAVIMLLSAFMLTRTAPRPQIA